MQRELQPFLKFLHWLLIAFLLSGAQAASRHQNTAEQDPGRVTNIIDNTINTDGIVDANTAIDQNGAIILEAVQPSTQHAQSDNHNEIKSSVKPCSH